MFAIVNVGGRQMKVEKDRFIFVNRLPQAEGETITLDQVLLISDNASTRVGAPTVSGASVTAKVLSHLKDDKVLVFKKKRRKGYQKMNGHRQALTKLQIQSINA